MRGDNFRPTWLNERIKKGNAECSNKTSKPITFFPPLPMESAATISESQDESALLSSLESRAADLKAELEVESKDVTEDKVNLDLQQFLAEIKDEDKEDLFTEFIDEVSMDGTGRIMPRCRCNYTDATRANDEEHFPVSI